MGLAKKVRILLAERECTQTELAKRLETSSANLSDKLIRDNLTEKDLIKIAEALDCDFEATFILRDSGKRI